jgi:hypothetical protein
MPYTFESITGTETLFVISTINATVIHTQGIELHDFVR